MMAIPTAYNQPLLVDSKALLVIKSPKYHLSLLLIIHPLLGG